MLAPRQADRNNSGQSYPKQKLGLGMSSRNALLADPGEPLERLRPRALGSDVRQRCGADLEFVVASATTTSRIDLHAKPSQIGGVSSAHWRTTVARERLAGGTALGATSRTPRDGRHHRYSTTSGPASTPHREPREPRRCLRSDALSPVTLIPVLILLGRDISSNPSPFIA
jgi:hypothetical protein